MVTNSAAVAEQVRLLREYGWRERYVSSVPGWNSRLDEIQAAVLRVKLRALDRRNEARRAVAALYDRALAGTSVVTPVQLPDRHHVFHQYVVRVAARDRLRAALASAGIGTGIHYPVPVHRQPTYLALGQQAHLPVTDSLSAEILSLPMYPQLGAAVAERVAQALRSAVAESRQGEA